MASDISQEPLTGRCTTPIGIAVGRRSRSLSELPEAQNAAYGVRDLFKSKRNILILLGVGFANFTVLISYTMLAPFFPAEGTKKGVSLTVTGLIFAVFPLIVVICSPVVGMIIPVLGPKFTLLLGLFIEGSAQLIFGFVDKMPNQTTFVFFCFLVRITIASGSSLSGTANLTIVAQTFGENMAVAFGVLETFLGLGVMAGPPLGGFLYQIGGFKMPFLVLGSLILFIAIVVFFVLPEDQAEEEEKQIGSLSSALRISSVTIVSFVVMMAGIQISFTDPTLAPHLSRFHLTSGEVGLMYLILTGGYTLTAPWFGVLSGKLKFLDPWCALKTELEQPNRLQDTRLMMTIGCFTCSISYLLLGPSPIFSSSMPKSLWLNGLSLGICGIGLSLLFIPSITDMNKSAVVGGMPANLATHGVISGVYNAMLNIGSTLGPTVAGSFSQYFGFGWASTIIAILLIVVGVILWTFTLFERRRSEKGSSEEKRHLIPRA